MVVHKLQGSHEWEKVFSIKNFLQFHLTLDVCNIKTRKDVLEDALYHLIWSTTTTKKSLYGRIYLEVSL